MKLYNIVKVYTSTVGTGTVTLGSAVPSFITFATAGVITGSTVSYAIEDGNNREVGTGVYTSGAETLTRTVVTSTNSNNAITLSGNAVVFITGLAADLSSDTAATANTLVIRNGSGNFALGTPTSGTLTNCTGLPISSGVSGLGTNVATFLATPSSANLASAVTDETGTGALVFANTPTLVTPLLGTPTSGTLTNCTGLPISTGVSGLAANVATFLATPSSANLAAALTDETGTGANVFANTPTLVTPILGTPTSGTLTNCTGLPISTGVSGLGSNVATFLATPSSANLASAVTDETGSGALVFGTSPTIATPTITTSATVPLVIGGTGTTSTLTLRSTSGVGTTGADIIFQTGNNGATEVMRLQNGGNVGIGTSSPQGKLAIGNYTIINALDGGSASSDIGNNLRFDGANWRYLNTGAASLLQFTAGDTKIFTAPSGTGGNIATLTERMRIDSSGNVGIGTASPSQKLDVVGNLSLSGQSTGNQYITIGSGRSSNGFSYIDLVGDTTYSSFGTRLIRGTGGANTGTSLQHRGTGEFQLYAYEAAPLVVYLNSAERMRIDSSGNVGIGTSSPAAKLDIRGAGAGIIVAPDNNSAGGISLFGTNAQTYGSPPIYFLSAANNGGYPTAGVGLGSLDFRNSAYGQGAYIYAYATQNHSSTASGGELRFGTTLNGSTSASERMRIDSSGNVGIGTSSPKQLLHVAGQGLFTSSSASPNPGDSAGNAVRIGYSSSGGYGYVVSNETGVINRPLLFDAQSIQFQIYSSERMRINDNGNVGIGTASPGHMLTVDKAQNGQTLVNVINTNVGTLSASGIRLTSDSGSVFFLKYGSSYSGYKIFGSNDSGIANQTSGNISILNDHASGGINFAAGGSSTVQLTLASTGNVGIGTSSPATRLHVLTANPTAANEVARFQGGTNNSNFRNYISCYTTNTGYWWELSNEDSTGTGSSNGFAFRERSAADPSVVRLYLASGGNVGIGTSTPATSAKLEIAGTTGALLVPRLTTTERNALTAVNGMIIYNTTDNQMQGRINGAWVAM